MPPLYYATFTTIGLQRLAEAQASYDPLVFTEMAVGDGGGSPITPDPAMTELVNETARVAVNTTEVSPDEPTTVRVEGLIPAATGGFTIREAGLFNAAGELIAIASYPPIYKPTPADGVSVDEYIRILLVYEEVEAIALSTDQNVIMATRQYVDERDDFWNSPRVKLWREHLIGVTSPPGDAQVTDYPLLRGHSNGTGSMGLGDPQESYAGRFVTMGGANGAIHSFGSVAPVACMADNRIICCEFDHYFGTEDGNLTSRAGFQNTSNALAGANTHLARMGRTDEVFRLYVGGDSFSDNVELTETPTYGEWHRIRIICFGATTPHAVAHGSEFTRLYVDDEVQAELDGVPDGAALNFGAGASCGVEVSSIFLGTWVVWSYDHDQPVPMPPLSDNHMESGYSTISAGTGDGSEYLDVEFERSFMAATGVDGYTVVVEINNTGSDDLIMWSLNTKTVDGFRILFTSDFDGEVRWRAYQ